MSDLAHLSLKKSILSKRDGLSPDVIFRKSGRIAEVLDSIPDYRDAALPFIYVSFRSEVATHGLIKERLAKGLAVAVPFTDIKNKRIIPFLIRNWERDLGPGSYGILAPDPSRAEAVRPGLLDIIIVPGSVFDRRCGRYGYGGGYYDRFLAQEALCALRIGLAFQLQLVKEMPLAPHDQKMDLIVTENEVIRCGRLG
ncbi:MAG: 5-formyltetrahydrofolate cyclo-ligase [Dissulfurimicrobium sp.]|uniref:5-formyltetrahydrofolate cyclo-ligase n=1 Tax=Dissulfurimicrobium TaxID=1769732 RepID=UPI001EDB2A67|nr:5-formyltetrahydrofolate cyclo-ligase [Dissulfurimicrobium hydrothermale]UKL13021.1 5-formyltetrahydrofolate cyclo-ligase [Dissulfurimicrobium hydrothermale]